MTRRPRCADRARLRPRPLDEPLNEAFRAATLTLGWDGDAERILIEARAQDEDGEPIEPDDDDDEDEDGPDLLRVRLTATPRDRSSERPSGSSHRADRPARCAATRSTRPATSVRAGTATTSTGDSGVRDQRRRWPSCATASWSPRLARGLVEQRDGGAGDRTGPDPESPTVIEAICKPTLGERPLFDFPIGTLTRREVAALQVSEALGWGIVPPTLLRDGPFGEGMLQAWIEPDPDVDVVAMVNDDDPRLRGWRARRRDQQHRPQGRPPPAGRGGRHLYGVDHGVCFSTVPKLRTVLWAWAGRRSRPTSWRSGPVAHGLGGALAND